jgi:PKD domain-containing protein
MYSTSEIRAGNPIRPRQSAQVKTSLRGNVGRGSLAAAFAAVLALSAALPVPAATDERDQYQTLFFNQQTLITMMAQTFTAGKTGQLDRVTMGSIATSSTTISVSVQTVNPATGKPSGTTLGTPVLKTGPWNCCATFKEVAFDPIPIEASRQYALVVQTLAGRFTWKNADSMDAYERGHAFVGDTWGRGSDVRSEDFTFETFLTASVAPPPNAAPAVGVDTAAVVVNEGTKPNNSGTYSDADGDTVGLTASAGSLTRTGTSSGTWAWTQPESDEAPVLTVAITANDGHEHATTKTFTVRVDAVAPVAHILLDPPQIPEGSPEKFTGGATVAYAADAADLAYGWTVTSGATTVASGSGTTFTFTPADDGTYVVTFKATDTDSTMSDTDSVTVYGQNVNPTAAISGFSAPSPLVAQEAVTFSGTFSDPGLLDWHRVTWSFGDATTTTKDYPATGVRTTSLSVSHIYTEAKTYTVRLQVVDKDGGVGQATTTVTVQTTQQALKALADSVNRLSGLNAGQKNSLIAKLNAAAASASRGDNKACNNQLNAFLNELSASVKTGKLSETDAAPFRTTVTAIKGSLGTYNRFLEWFTLVF